MDHKDNRKEIGHLQDKVKQLLQNNELLINEKEKAAKDALKKRTSDEKNSGNSQKRY